MRCDANACASLLSRCDASSPAGMRGKMLALRAMYETLAISAPTVLEALVGRVTLEKCDARLARWSKRLLAQIESELVVTGSEHIGTKESFILMSNHQSHYDIPALMQAFPRSLRMVTKTELFKVPIWGGALRASGFIEVDRKNRVRAIASLRRAKESLDRGISIWIAPEGTRSRTGELLPFKKGGFILAQETGLRILPVGIAGTRAILPAKAADVQRGVRVTVSFGAPISVEGDRDALITRVRDEILRLRGAG